MTSTEQILDTDVRITGSLKVHGPIDGTASMSKWRVLYGATAQTPSPSGGTTVFATGGSAKSIDQLINGLEAGGFNVGIYNSTGSKGLLGLLLSSSATLTLTASSSTYVLVRNDVALQ